MEGRELVLDRAGAFAKNKPVSKKADARQEKKASITGNSFRL